eukprot:TRINITY_DN824_c0_g2_i1.p1 TRINITY_DN824_c0_g2~~TRINITY_DN824_c0_g2_i1.p1  ORF type:complete len:206 (+),score=70.74 TRINITY_DN824_c0_g2_i1:81-620(+)
MMKLIACALLLSVAAVAATPLPFSWSNCGAETDPIQLQTFTVTPSPIVFGGNVTVSVVAKLAVTITAMKVQLNMEKQMGSTWVQIPCVDGIGSCTWDDICPLLANETCPSELSQYNIPCHCPFPAGVYELPATTVGPIKQPPSYLEWLTNGNYRVTANMKNPTDNSALGCIQIILSLAN